MQPPGAPEPSRGGQVRRHPFVAVSKLTFDVTGNAGVGQVTATGRYHSEKSGCTLQRDVQISPVDTAEDIVGHLVYGIAVGRVRDSGNHRVGWRKRFTRTPEEADLLGIHPAPLA